MISIKEICAVHSLTYAAVSSAAVTASAEAVTASAAAAASAAVAVYPCARCILTDKTVLPPVDIYSIAVEVAVSRWRMVKFIPA